MRKIYPRQLKKFTLEQVAEMRRKKRTGYSRRELAEIYNCNITTIDHWTSDIINQESLKEVK